MDTTELKRRFGRRVKLLRERAALTQEQLAEKIDRTVDAVSNIERGIHATKIEIAYLISQAVNVPLEDLFELEPDTPKDRERRKELNLLVDELQALDVRTLQAFRRMVEVILEAQSSVKPRTRR